MTDNDNRRRDGGDDSPAYEQPLLRPWKDADRLRRLYHEERLTQQQIADRFGIDDSTVSYWFDQFGIETGYTDSTDGGDDDE